MKTTSDLNFFSSPYCKSKTNCEICRNKGDDGANWRLAALGICGDFKDGTKIDFECVDGLPWRENEVRKKELLSHITEATRSALRKIRLGDKIAAATSAIGIKPCGGCKKRQAILNGETI